MGLNKLRSVLKKKEHHPNHQMYNVIEINNSEKYTLFFPSPIPGYYMEAKEKIIETYSSVSRDDLPAGLPPAREGDYKIKILDNAKTHRALFQLFPS